jgi:integrase
MPRTSSVTFTLSTKNGRSKIPFGPKLHNVQLPAEGLLIGYRKNPSGGIWFASKRRLGTSQYDRFKIGPADDTKDCDGETIFSYQQACAKADRWYREESGCVAASNKAYTVRDLVAEYREERKTKKGKTENSTMKSHFEAHVLPVLGEVPLRKLTAQQVTQWFEKLPKKAPGNGKRVVDAKEEGYEEYLRKRRSTANRTLAIFCAVLNWGYKKGRVQSKAAWERIEKYQEVNEPRIVEITREELQASIDNCDPGFQPLARGAVYTGARYAELGRMRVRDFNPKTSKVYLPKTKTDNPRYVFLHGEALEMFVELARGKKPSDHIFVRPTDGKPWAHGDQQSRMKVACEKAGVTLEFTFHQFRHQCACICLENGMAMAEVSYMLGHRSIATTERNYARYSKDHMQNKVEQYAPRLGFGAAPKTPAPSKVVVLPVPVAR